jgi:hypothetical protein
MPFLQAGVFKHSVVRKRRVGGGWALVKVAGNEDGGSIDGKVIKAGSFAC